MEKSTPFMHKESGENIKKLFNDEALAESERQFNEALKRVRGLYYKDMIAEQSGGKKGERVTLDVLSEDDLTAFRRVYSEGGDRVPLEMEKFVEEILETK